MSSKRYLSWSYLGLALCCSAQDYRIGGPITGVVFDAPSRSLRQIVGMPGAARVSPAILAEVDWASVAPNGRTVIAITQGEVKLFSHLDGSPDPASSPITGMVESPVFASWAADSSAVVLYSAANRSIQWMRISSQGADVDQPVSLDGVEGDVTAMTGDNASGLVIVAVANAGIFRVSATDGTVSILTLADASAIALEAGGRKLWVADRGSASVLELTEPGTQSDPQTLLTDPEKLSDLSTLGLSSDNKRLHLASRSARRLYTFDLATSTLSDGIELDAPATALQPLGRPTLLLLGPRAKEGEPLYLFDESSGPAIFFVPVGEGN